MEAPTTEQHFEPELTTARLRLRRASRDFAGEIYERYATDVVLTRFMTWQPHRSPEETHAYLSRCEAEWASGTRFTYMSFSTAADRLIGAIDAQPDGHTVRFGYLVARPEWGKGYATEALSALVRTCLDRPGVWRASAFHDCDNPASGRVMQKAGMEFEGILRRYFVHPNVSPYPRDCALYARVKSAP